MQKKEGGAPLNSRINSGIQGCAPWANSPLALAEELHESHDVDLILRREKPGSEEFIVMFHNVFERFRRVIMEVWASLADASQLRYLERFEVAERDVVLKPHSGDRRASDIRAEPVEFGRQTFIKDEFLNW